MFDSDVVRQVLFCVENCSSETFWDDVVLSLYLSCVDDFGSGRCPRVAVGSALWWQSTLIMIVRAIPLAVWPVSCR